VPAEALGSLRMAGVADNLSAMLEDRYHRGNYQEITDRADAPLEDAVALMVRERLTGNAPPASSRKIVDLWRPWIEERAGDDFSRLTGAIEDQARFADAIRDILSSLEMGDEMGSESGDDSEEGDSDAAEEDDRGNLPLAEAEGLREAVDRERRIRIGLRVAGPAHLVRGIEHGLGGVELRQEEGRRLVGFGLLVDVSHDYCASAGAWASE